MWCRISRVEALLLKLHMPESCLQRDPLDLRSVASSVLGVAWSRCCMAKPRTACCTASQDVGYSKLEGRVEWRVKFKRDYMAGYSDQGFQ